MRIAQRAVIMFRHRLATRCSSLPQCRLANIVVNDHVVVVLDHQISSGATPRRGVPYWSITGIVEHEIAIPLHLNNICISSATGAGVPKGSVRLSIVKHQVAVGLEDQPSRARTRVNILSLIQSLIRLQEPTLVYDICVKQIDCGVGTGIADHSVRRVGLNIRINLSWRRVRKQLINLRDESGNVGCGHRCTRQHDLARFRDPS